MTAINRFALDLAVGARPMSMNCYALRLAATEVSAIKRHPASALRMAQSAAAASFGAAGELELALPQLRAAAASPQRAGDAKRRAAPNHDSADPFADAISTISAASDADRSRILDLHKSWHVLHYLFTGAAEGGTPPADALLAGRACGEDLGYGAPRLHEPAATAAFARFLAPLTVAELQRRIDLARMRALGIYCCEEGVESAAALGDDVDHYFPLLQEFVTAAAKTGNGMLVWLS
jgi:hypothetical protein